MELLDRKIHMFELVVGELDLILGNLDERRSFEDLMMDIWVLRQAEDRRSPLRRPGDSLLPARAPYEQVKDVNEAVLGGAGEAGSPVEAAPRCKRSSSTPSPTPAPARLPAHRS